MPPRGCGRDAVGMRPRDVVEMWLSLRERLGACAVHHPPQLPLGEARGRGAAGGVAAGQGLRAKRRASPRLQRGTGGGMDGGGGGGNGGAPHTPLPPAPRRAPLGGELRRPERPLLGPCLLQGAARQSRKLPRSCDSLVCCSPPPAPCPSQVLSEPGSVELMGSATWEGTYFVFIDCS